MWVGAVAIMFHRQRRCIHFASQRPIKSTLEHITASTGDLGRLLGLRPRRIQQMVTRMVTFKIVRVWPGQVNLWHN